MIRSALLLLCFVAALTYSHAQTTQPSTQPATNATTQPANTIATEATSATSITESSEVIYTPLDEITRAYSFVAVRNWVASGKVGSFFEDFRADDIFAVQVTIRHEGTRFGRGKAQRASLAFDKENPSTLLSLLKTATGNAIEQARLNYMRHSQKILLLEQTQSDEDESIFEKSADGEKKEKKSKVVPFADFAKKFTIEIELANNPTPVSLTSRVDILRKYTLGVDGIGMYKGKNFALAFPGSSITDNLTHMASVDRLVGELKQPLGIRSLIGKEGGPALFKFNSIHMVNLKPAGEKTLMHRAHQLRPLEALKPAETIKLNDRLANAIMAWQTSAGQYRGMYKPSAGRFEGEMAEDFDAALATYALTVYVESTQDEAKKVKATEAVKRGVMQQLIAMGIVADPKRKPGEAVPGPDKSQMIPVAFTILSILNTPELELRLKTERRKLADWLIMMQNPTGWFRPRMIADANKGTDNLATYAGQSIAMYTLGKLYSQSRGAKYLTAFKKAEKIMWEQMTDSGYVLAQPWLVKSQVLMTGLKQPPLGMKQSKEIYLPAMWRWQVSPLMAEQGLYPKDSIGGFATLAQGQKINEPTWQSARMLGAQIELLADPTLVTGDARTEWLSKTKLGLRYIDQLSLKTEEAYYSRFADTAVGGIRSASYNNQQALHTTALSLITVARALQVAGE